MSAPPETVPAIVLAGGRTSPEFALAAGVPAEPGARALAVVAGEPMVVHVLRALQQAGRIGRIILVAPAGFPAQAEADVQVVSNGLITQNIHAGMACCPQDEFALCVTADIPFLTPAAVDDYVERALAEGHDTAYSVVSRTACDAEFPGMPRTYLRTPRGDFTGGNLVLQRICVFGALDRFLVEAHARRKDPIYLARLIGFGNVVRLLTGQLTLERIGDAVTRIVGIRCGLVESPYAVVGTDVDRPEDLTRAEARWRAQGADPGRGAGVARDVNDGPR